MLTLQIGNLGNMGVMNYLCLEGLDSLSALIFTLHLDAEMKIITVEIIR